MAPGRTTDTSALARSSPISASPRGEPPSPVLDSTTLFIRARACCHTLRGSRRKERALTSGLPRPERRDERMEALEAEVEESGTFPAS